MTRYTCSTCGRELTKTDALERRIEFRSLDDLSRWKTRRTGFSCKTCALSEIGDLPAENQAALWPDKATRRAGAAIGRWKAEAPED
jgi:DNA-directed RNA polymerase subunit RPC12/RpoP